MTQESSGARERCPSNPALMPGFVVNRLAVDSTCWRGTSRTSRPPWNAGCNRSPRETQIHSGGKRQDVREPVSVAVWIPHHVETALRMREEHYSSEDIGRTLGVGASTVCRALGKSDTSATA